MKTAQHRPPPITEYLGSITVVVRARSPRAAAADLKEAAHLIEDRTPGVIFADHNGDVELWSAVERECMSEPASSNLPTRFDGYEIHGMRHIEPNHDACEPVDDSEAQFWSLFGHVPGSGLECIGDFASREQAEYVYARITGHSY